MDEWMVWIVEMTLQDLPGQNLKDDWGSRGRSGELGTAPHLHCNNFFSLRV